ncbi:MAG: PHP domain-containing protein [Acidimicrobiales bacterium]
MADRVRASQQRPGPTLPPDNHVHTEFSWDAEEGSMIESCRRAVALGLPSIAFTEHVDLTPWVVPEAAAANFPPDVQRHLGRDGRLRAPEVDLDGYFESIDRCRSQFPSLRILSGLEIGEPHWFPELAADLLAAGPFQRVLGSLHSLTIDAEPRLIDEWFRTDRVEGEREATAVRSYLAEAVAMIESSDHFEVFAHIDYLVRQIEAVGRRHDPTRFEEEYRETLRALSTSGRVLEINTRLELDPLVVEWWYDVGGTAVSFGSDAHRGQKVGGGFRRAAALAESKGFRPQSDPHDFWRR